MTIYSICQKEDCCSCPEEGQPYCKEHISEQVDHPAHYGGADDPYETIKVIEAWKLNFALGNSVKYISRAGRKGSSDLELVDLRKARWYLNRHISAVEAAQCSSKV